MTDEHRREPAPREGSGLEQYWRRCFELRGARFDSDADIAGWSHSGLGSRFRRFRAIWRDVEYRSGYWLDAGCGAGTYSRFLAACGRQVIGVDYSVPSLTKARAQAREGISWCAADLRRLPAASATFDGILCLGVMQSLEDPDPTLAELVRVLRPGGSIWVDGLNRYFVANVVSETWRYFRRRPRHLRYDAPSKLRRRLLSMGADRVELYWMPLAPGRWPWLQNLLEYRATVWVLSHAPLLGALLSHSFILRVDVGSGPVKTS